MSGKNNCYFQKVLVNWNWFEADFYTKKRVLFFTVFFQFLKIALIKTRNSSPDLSKLETVPSYFGVQKEKYTTLQ